MSSCTTTTTTPTQVTLIQGEDRELFFGLKDKEEQVFVDLSLATEIQVTIASTLAGYPVEFKMTDEEIEVTDAPKGKFKVMASDAKTTQLKLGELSVEIIIDWNEKRVIDSWAFSGLSITLTFLENHTMEIGDIIDISGLVSSTNAPNGLQTITAITGTTVTFIAAGTPTGSPTVSNAKAVATTGMRRISQVEKAIIVKKRLF